MNEKEFENLVKTTQIEILRTNKDEIINLEVNLTKKIKELISLWT
jgi:hypothetical protein